MDALDASAHGLSRGIRVRKRKDRRTERERSHSANSDVTVRFC